MPETSKFVVPTGYPHPPGFGGIGGYAPGVDISQNIPSKQWDIRTDDKAALEDALFRLEPGERIDLPIGPPITQLEANELRNVRESNRQLREQIGAVIRQRERARETIKLMEEDIKKLSAFKAVNMELMERNESLREQNDHLRGMISDNETLIKDLGTANENLGGEVAMSRGAVESLREENARLKHDNDELRDTLKNRTFKPEAWDAMNQYAKQMVRGIERSVWGGVLPDYTTLKPTKTKWNTEISEGPRMTYNEKTNKGTSNLSARETVEVNAELDASDIRSMRDMIRLYKIKQFVGKQVLCLALYGGIPFAVAKYMGWL